MKKHSILFIISLLICLLCSCNNNNIEIREQDEKMDYLEKYLVKLTTRAEWQGIPSHYRVYGPFYISVAGDINDMNIKWLSINMSGDNVHLWPTIHPEGRQEWYLAKDRDQLYGGACLIYSKCTDIDKRFLSMKANGKNADGWYAIGEHQHWVIERSINGNSVIRNIGPCNRRNFLSAHPSNHNVDGWNVVESMRQEWIFYDQAGNLVFM